MVRYLKLFKSKEQHQEGINSAWQVVLDSLINLADSLSHAEFFPYVVSKPQKYFMLNHKEDSIKFLYKTRIFYLMHSAVT